MGKGAPSSGWDWPNLAARCGAMQDATAHLLAWKGMAVLLWLAVVFAAERLAPAAPFPIKVVRPGPRLLGNAGPEITR